ncbi:MAG: TolC family protein [Nitrospirota bacterium]
MLIASGPSSAEKTVSLKEAISLALRQNPGLKALKSSTMARKEDVGSARSHLLPKVYLEERYMRTDNPTLSFSSKLNQERFAASDFAIARLNDPASIGDWQTSLSFEQPIFSREANIGYRMARTESAAAFIDMRRMEEKVAMTVIESFLNVSSAEDMVRAADKGIEDAREHKRVADVLLEAGAGLYSDTLRADVALKEAEERRVRAQKALKVSKRALGLALGLDEPVGIRGEGIDFEPFELPRYVDAASERSDAMALELRVENAGNSLDLAEAAYLPVLGVGGSYQLNDHRSVLGDEGDSYTVMAFLRWTVFEGNLRSHELAKARYKLKEAEERLDGLRKKVSFQVHEAYFSMQEARASLELARSRAALAEEAARLVKVRYENSLAKIVDLLGAQASLDAARADVVGKRNSYLMSIAELSYQSGLIMQDFVEQAAE